jgi:hypothetical protein
MRNVSIICDRCNEVVLEHASVLTITAAGDLKSCLERIDLCRECAGQLLDWLRHRVVAEALEVVGSSRR